MTSPMLPPDNHVHSEFSWDTGAEASMERTCERALRLGLPAVAFTEHVDFTEWGAHDNLPSDGVRIATRERVRPLDVDGYLASVEACRARFPDLRILSGIEAGEPHHFAGSVAAVLGRGRFDRVLGSLHSVVRDGQLVGVDKVLRGRLGGDEELRPDAVMRAYFAEMLRLVDGSDAFQVLAHCDYPRRYWPTRQVGDYREADFEEEYRTVFRALAGSGRALELNTRSPLASATLMRWWYDEGGDAVSFGSDAHVPLRVGDLFDVAVDVVAAAGFRPGRDEYDFWRR
jgi:histidinol-phosphatase (PHP family)